VPVNIKLRTATPDDAQRCGTICYEAFTAIANQKALIGAATVFAGPGILLPMRNWELFRWCLDDGLRVVKPMTLTSFGLYNEPVGAFLPSVLY
jgi:hypothetical protein